MPAHGGARAGGQPLPGPDARGGGGRAAELVAEDRERKHERERGELRPCQDRDPEGDHGHHVAAR